MIYIFFFAFRQCEPTETDWTSKKSSTSQDLRPPPGRLVRIPPCKPPNRNNWQSTPSSTQSKHEEETSSVTTTTSNDSRKSILECDVNPYFLLKNQQYRKDEDDLSDDLSDNALEQPNSNLFDPSKVKSIERIPNRSSVAAIGGQRIRVFNEIREPSDEDDLTLQPTLTRIPIPKISPKRPPRRLKEAKNALKSILKRASDQNIFQQYKRKSVLFNVDNVILAPEKPTADICVR